MSKTKKRITTPLIHEKGHYVHRVRRIEDEDALAQIEEELRMMDDDVRPDEQERLDDLEWDQYFERLHAEVAMQEAWQQAIDDESSQEQSDE